MSVPILASEVTKDWLLEVLTNNDNPVKEIISLTEIKDNEGFLSGVFKAEVSFKNGDEGNKKLFIKMGLPPDHPFNTFTAAFDVDKAEVKAYKEYLPMLTKFEAERLAQKGKPEMPNLSPRLYAGGFAVREDGKRGFFLVMDDISPDYYLVKPVDGLNRKQAETAVTKIARLHAVSYAFSQINELTLPEELMAKVPKFMEDPGVSGMLEGFIKLAIEDFAKDPEAVHLRPHLNKLLKNYKAAALKAFREDSRFLIHADYWCNNVMFSKTDEDECRVYDWQFFTGGSPFLDVANLMFLSLDTDVSKYLDINNGDQLHYIFRRWLSNIMMP